MGERGRAIEPGLIHAFQVFALSLFIAVLAPLNAALADTVLSKYIEDVAPGDMVPGADAFGPIRDDAPVAPALAGGRIVGWVFLTSDWVPTTGYSGKPIHIIAGISDQAVITGVRLMKHSEPIVLVGIPETRIRAVIEKYAGLDLREAEASHSADDIDIVSGATVTIMVIDDSILRAGIKVAQSLKLGGFAPVDDNGPKRVLDRDAGEVTDWETLAGIGALRHLVVDVDTINADFAALGDPRTEKETEPPPGTDPYVDLWTALVSEPSIGRSVLGEDGYANLLKMLKPGDEAIVIAGSGRWSFKGSGYVRGGIFDRFQLIQGEISHRFRDKEHRRLVRIEADGAPDFNEMDLFVIPADSGFDPARSWRLQFLVHRAVGPIEKQFRSYELGYDIPATYTREIVQEVKPRVEAPPAATSTNRDALWARIWETKRVQIIVLSSSLVVLSMVFFFQQFFVRRARLFLAFRMAFLTFTLVYIGWYANAQLSVVNILAVFSAIFSNFSWETFLMDPLIFLLWLAVAAALLFWARGAYCGWLCPFGAFQELLNRVAKLARIPQVKLPWGLHERLWAVKYIIFLGLFGLSLYSLDLAEHYAEVEPFKTAIILKFARPAPYVLFALAMLAPSLFIERFYCRYVCPLGGGLAIPARLHMFRWLKRYRECGNPCQRCATDCPVEAIHPTGEINPNECIQCLNCQVLYNDHDRCPVVIAKDKRRAKDLVAAARLNPDLVNHPNIKPEKELAP
ncbi:NosR/NirI family protein [Frigidibacter sp. ROC022]|uniref:NosR/NirI family protein n=1 Tax=Frigidibacter sp. ROC022 TaxID=2971796 RepID=UPI00215A13AC|nr:NosR/NirI family protein [Frigidibacter sp. ROC022]MCR8726122.1 NosR/NirI family protein [Frigidibacter sp. ROC022]